VRERFEISYAEPLSLAQAAGIASLEAKHFSKIFRRKVGIGFKEWTDFVRIGKAMDAIQAEYQSLSVHRTTFEHDRYGNAQNTENAKNEATALKRSRQSNSLRNLQVITRRIEFRKEAKW
jgi:methylphosphotriester-DNA--protein-cysteine methyltransferase